MQCSMTDVVHQRQERVPELPLLRVEGAKEDCWLSPHALPLACRADLGYSDPHISTPYIHIYGVSPRWQGDV